MSMINDQEHESACKTLALYLSKCGIEKFTSRERVLTFNPQNLRYILARIRALNRDDTVSQGQGLMTWIASWTNSDKLTKSELEMIHDLIKKTPVLTLKSKTKKLESTELDLVMFECLKILDIRKCNIIFVGAKKESPLPVATLYLRESKVDLNNFTNLTNAVIRASPGTSFRHVDGNIIGNLTKLEVTHGTIRALAEVLQVYSYKQQTKKTISPMDGGIDSENNTDSDVQSNASSSSKNQTSSSSSYKIQLLYSSLHTLVCSHNSIDMLDNSLKYAPNLKRLNLMHNKIQNFNIYEGQTSTNSTSSSNPPSTPMSPRSTVTDQFEDEFEYNFLPSITHLNLSYNHLTIWPSARPYLLLNLTHLDVSHNHLTTTKHVEYLPRLVVLNLGYNEIAKWEEIEHVAKELRLLEEITLKGNSELETKYDYRSYACGHFRLKSKLIFDGQEATRYELDYHYHQKVALLGDKDKVFDDAVLEDSNHTSINLSTNAHPVEFENGTFSTISDMTDLMESPPGKRHRRTKRKRKRKRKRVKTKKNDVASEMNADDQAFFQSMGQHVGESTTELPEVPTQLTMNYQEKLQLMEDLKEKYGALWLEAYNDYLHRTENSPQVKKEEDPSTAFLLPGDKSDVEVVFVPSAGEKSSESGTDDSNSRLTTTNVKVQSDDFASQFLNVNIQVFQNFLKKKHHNVIELNNDIRSFLEPNIHDEIEVDYVKEQHYFNYKDTSMEISPKDVIDVDLPDEELDQILLNMSKKINISLPKLVAIEKFAPHSMIHTSTRQSRRNVQINLSAVDTSSLPEHEKAKWEEKERLRQQRFEYVATRERKNSDFQVFQKIPSPELEAFKEEQEGGYESEDIGLSEFEMPDTAADQSEFSESDGEYEPDDFVTPEKSNLNDRPRRNSILKKKSVKPPSVPAPTPPKNKSNVESTSVASDDSTHETSIEDEAKENMDVEEENKINENEEESETQIDSDKPSDTETKETSPQENKEPSSDPSTLSLVQKPKRKRGKPKKKDRVPIRKPSVMMPFAKKPEASPTRPTVQDEVTKNNNIVKHERSSSTFDPRTTTNNFSHTRSISSSSVISQSAETPDDDQVLFESHIWKQGGTIKNWKRRLFTLNRHHWSYGEIRNSILKIYGTGSIDDVIQVSRDHVGRVPNKCKAFSGYGVKLTCRKGKTKKRTFKILTESEEDCVQFVSSFEKLMALSANLFVQQDDDLETASVLEGSDDESDDDVETVQDDEMIMDGDDFVSKLIAETV